MWYLNGVSVGSTVPPKLSLNSPCIFFQHPVHLAMFVWFLAVKPRVLYANGCQHVWDSPACPCCGAHWWLGRICAGSAKPQTSILTFPLGQYCFPSIHPRKIKFFFPPKWLSVGEEWDTTRHHPDLPLCFPFPFSPLIVLEQELSVVYVQPRLGFTGTFKALSFQLWQHLHAGCRCRSLWNLPSLQVRIPAGFLRAKIALWNGLGWRGS